MDTTKNSRKSYAFSTPQEIRRRGSSQSSRYSLSNIENETDIPESANNELFKTLMTDPLKKAVFMQFFQSNNKVDKSLLEVMKKKATHKRPPVKKKRFESPTAQFRRRALKAQDSDKLSSDESLDDDLPPSSASFDRLLDGVIAYVEIMSNDKDKSGGVKALLTSMGARVVDKIAKGITHVIFKDGSFQTCRKAKLVDAHLVSVLWVEAVRKNHCKVPEEKYPALGTKAFNPNVSDLCEQLQRDYEDVVRDEMERSRNLKRSMSCNLPSRYSEDIIPPSQKCDSRSNVSTFKKTKKSVPAPSVRLEFSSEASSDSDSDIGLIGGEIINRIPSLDLTHTSVGSIEREAIEAINSKLNDFDRSRSAEKSKLDKSESSRNSSVREADNSRRTSRNTSSRKNSLSKENLNGKFSNSNKSLNNLRISSESSTRGESESPPLSELQPSNHSNKQLRRNSKRKTINSIAASNYGKELAEVLENSKNCGSESTPLTELDISDSSNKKLHRNSRRTTINSSVNNLSQLRVSDPVKNTSRTSNGQSVGLNKSDTTKRSTGILISSRKSDTESTPLSELENLDPANKRLSRSSRRKTNSSANILSQLRISDPVEIPPDKNNGESVDLRLSDPKEPVGFSEPVPTLRISDASSKRRQTVSSTSTMSSLRISIASSKSNDVHESPNKESHNTDPNVHVTLRKKRPINKNNVIDTSDNSDDTSSKTKQNVKNGKRRLYDPNDPFLVPRTPNEPKKPPNDKKKSDKSPDDLEIAPILMTPKAKALLQKLNRGLDSLNFDDDIVTEKECLKTPSPPKKPNTTKAKTQPEPTTDVFKEPKTPAARKAKSQKNPAATPTRRSTRKSISVSQSDDDFEPAEDLIRSQRNRRSTQEFLPKETFKSQTKLKNTQSKLRKASSIVCSRFHRPEVQTFHQIVRKLGKFFVEDEVTEKTTHLVIAEPKRTINLLRAIARGCWILKSEWLYKSLEERKWLQEEDYEMTDYSPAVQQSRQQRQAFGVLYSMDLFKDCGNIYIAKSSTPRCSDLQELVSICKGRITTIYRNAKIVVGEHVEGITCVTENWILDSITFYKKKSLKNYIMEPPLSRRQSLDF